MKHLLAQEHDTNMDIRTLGFADGHSKYTVLVVEDDTAQRDSLKELLELAGFDVVTAPNGRNALDVTERMQPDIVLLDVHLPVMDGLTMLRLLREGWKTLDVPVVLISADLSPEILETGLIRGAEDFVQKPYSARELLLRIRGTLEARNRYLHAARTKPEKMRFISDEERFLERLRSTVETIFSAGGTPDFSHRIIADAMSISIPTLHRHARRALRMSLGEWLLEYRLERARQMVVSGSGSMAEIAHRTGFAGPAHFSQSFRRRFGTPPRLYRINARNGESAPGQRS